MNIIGVIPARMDSSRLQGKPLIDIHGVPMVGHVYFRSKMCKFLDDVYVATCDNEIKDYVNFVGGKVVMTSNTHKRASDRTAEALIKIEKETNRRIDVVVMIQGDEPMIYPEMLDNAILQMVNDRNIYILNLMSLMTKEEHNDPNEVKVVVDLDNFALYFSREPIPSWKKGAADVPMLKQICIIPFERDFLIKFNKLETTPLEIIESVDMLRVLEHGYKVKMIMSEYETYSVDTIQDLEKVTILMVNDPLRRIYK